jgi:putative spermidine/putrescine transport system permease protein
MTDATMQTAPGAAITTNDGVPLKQSLARATRRQRYQALMLVMPLLLFLLIAFVMPIGEMLFRSVYSPVGSSVLPKFSEVIQDWDGKDLPPEETFKVFVEDMKLARSNREIGATVGNLATRVNYEIPGSRGLFTSTSRKLRKVEEPLQGGPDCARQALGRSAHLAHAAARRAGLYLSFYLAATDRKYDENNNIVMADPLYQIYLPILWKTLWLSALITLICLIIAYPVAYLLATLPLRTSNLLMIMVLLPFWTSLLVRTTAWIAMLQKEGVLNNIFVFANIISDENRVQMIYNQTGTIIAMVHILLPFMILPLYSVMKTIPPYYMRAARSLGATGTYSFIKVYFPQTLPGIGAGTLLVFILAMGYYITPALVGGSDGLLISNLIADHIKKTLNWSLGSALGAILLVIVLVFYWIYNKLIGVDNLKFG